jgi:ribA/ribD-fused uncharacterized protein
VKDKEDLLRAKANGRPLDFLFFWGHRASIGPITKSCLSQWYEAPFKVDEAVYATAEHFMMARKAELFGDLTARDAIVAALDPGKAKALGHRVEGFDESIWCDHRFSIVVEANMHKFSQHPRLEEFLLHTNAKILVEASPMDAVWGIGLAMDATAADDPAQWPGMNLLGFALMQVRKNLRV